MTRSGVELIVIPGYQRMTAAQRETLLQLAETGELLAGRIEAAPSSAIARAYVVRDRAGARFLLYSNGEHHRLVEPQHSRGGRADAAAADAGQG